MPAFFTIVSANYIAFAATLMQSVRRFHPDAARFIILADVRHDFGDLDLAAEIIACDELGIALIGNMQLWYSVIEFNTAVKPFAFGHLFTVRGFDAAIYLDPDIQLYAPLHHVLAALNDHSLVLTPHMTKPLQDGHHPSDLSIMKSGVYNLGFAALRNDEDGRTLLDWWRNRLFTHCRVDIAANIFTDQRWMDLAPAFVDRVKLLRRPGYNVAYWNLLHRIVEQGEDGMWRANGEPLAFFHFSGIDPEDPAVFSRHQDRFTAETLGAVARLCQDYRARVLANGWAISNKIPYAYARFADGRRIESAMRHWLLEAVDDGRLPATKRLRAGSAFFDAADERRFAADGQLTRFAHQLLRDRPDLQAAFNLHTQIGFDGYVAWFCDGAAASEGLDPALIDAARSLRDRPHAPHAPTLRTAPPWPSMASGAWNGPARDVAQWLTGDLDFDLDGASHTIQRQSALLWERRLDLQSFFHIHTSVDLEDYHLWCLTDGMREGSVDSALFSDRYHGWLTALSSTSRLYDDVPVTHALALTRRSEHAREGLQSWREFPLTRQSRLEQAFWFAFIAPRLFGWPASIAAPVRAYLQEPAGPSAVGYAFTRGMLACHELRQDVSSSFPLDDEAGRSRFLAWLLLEGAKQLGADLDDLCPGIAAHLAQPSPDFPLLTRLTVLAYGQRQDLQNAFNLRSRAGVAGMQEWSKGELRPWLASVGLSCLMPAANDSTTARDTQPHRCRVALAGDWSVPSGIGEDLRTSVAALDACGFADYVIVDLPSRSILGPDRTVLPPGTPIQAAWQVVFHNADTAATDWLICRRLGVEADRVAGHWLWELERLPSYWTHAYSFVDEIWASSEFVRGIFEPEGRRPVHLLHHAVIVPPLTEPASRRDLGLHDDSCTFLFMFDFASYAARKNPEAVIAAFLQAFPTGNERACLVLKTQNAELRPDLWMSLANLTDDPRVLLRDAKIPRDELTKLIASANAFVSLHRSEGFGRGPAEAMLLGVPVILTGYSGVSDFVDDGCACIVGYALVPVQPGDYPGVEGQRWAEPDISQAAGYMRWVHDNPAEARAMGERGQERAAHQLAPDRIGRMMTALLIRS